MLSVTLSIVAFVSKLASTLTTLLGLKGGAGVLFGVGFLPTGHRRRGSGISLDSRPDLERAMIFSRHLRNTWYVDSNTMAGSAADGTTWGGAYALLQTAITAASAGDTILVADGHVEAIAAAATIAISKGVAIIGLGKGRRRPVFTWGTLTTATITIAGANVHIENCVFVGTGVDAVVTMFAVTGDDCTFAGCEFDIATSAAQVSLGITITGTDRFRFYDNQVHGTADAGCTNFIQIVGSAGKQKDYEFVNNSIIGAFTTSLGCINNITTAMVNCLIRDNVFVNLTASATKVVVLLTGSTGLIMKNTCGIGSGAVPFTADAAHWAGNWSAAAVATNGTLV